ncbi:MAG: gluconeogenesis factor YvcK family protein [Pyrinomonadaceae bacterium]
MNEIISNRGLRLVAIGGGTGLSTLLSGLKKFVGPQKEEVWLESLSAIVTVSDDGGSSGRLRDELQMLPPGDIRNCMIALSEDSNLLSRLFRHRFGGSGDLAGHSFGNLFLAALADVTGDFVEAVRLSSEVLASKGHIFPATTTDVRLVAELEDGRTVHGETQITAAKSEIRSLRLEPDHCEPLPGALAAIRAADVITLGPGSLYTSLLPNLLVSEVPNAIAESPGTQIFVTNLMTQPGETDGFDAQKHLATVKKYAPQIQFDYVLLNDRSITGHQASLYAADGAFQVTWAESRPSANGTGYGEIVRTNLLEEGEMVRHDPDQLARVVLACGVQKPVPLPLTV